MAELDNFKETKECFYKEEHYSVRDNGAIMRHQREGKRIRKDDNVWTFGKPNIKTGYMEFSGERVHRIVAYAFHGNPPSEQHVVDHIDTNRQNNRPKNLRWLTRLENVLNNPITRAKIIQLCGSVEAFLANPSILRGHEHLNANFSWMRTVTAEEAKVSLELLAKWAQKPTPPKGGALGEWIFQEKNTTPIYQSQPTYTKQADGGIENKDDEEIEEELIKTMSHTPNATQINWRTPTLFPCCPQEVSDTPLKQYKENLKVDSVFSSNNYGKSVVLDSALIDNDNSLLVLTYNPNSFLKPWTIAKVTYNNGRFAHMNYGSYFEEKGARKYFAIIKGEEWDGEDGIDDYC